MYNVELKEYFEERYKREFRHNTIGSRSETCLYSEILFPLYKQNIIDFREKLVTQLKVPEIAGEKYTYKNLELVYYKCGQYWKKKNGNRLDVNNRKECEKEIRQFRFAGTI